MQKCLLDWLASMLGVPLFALIATQPLGEYRKPAPGMWHIMRQELNGGLPIDVASCTYVGDLAGRDGDKSSSDRDFARSIGAKYGTALRFRTPTDMFGLPDGGLHGGSGPSVDEAPRHALDARAALLGAYSSPPILLVLCGPQGAGKSTFCKLLLNSTQKSSDAAVTGFTRESVTGSLELQTAPSTCRHLPWTVVCQDTAANGKPGKREVCEARASAALRKGSNVVVDRTNLSPSQREHFIRVANEAGVRAHALVLLPKEAELLRRVKYRLDHPASVQGESGVAIARRSLSTMLLPDYSEGFELISTARTALTTTILAALYGNITRSQDMPASMNDDAVVPPYPLELVPGASTGSSVATCGVALRLHCRSAGTEWEAGVALYRDCREQEAPSDEVAQGFSDETAKVDYNVLPAIALGTMELKGDALAQMLKQPWSAVDTAPTYNNETAIGRSCGRSVFLIVKTPRAVTGDGQGAAEVRMALQTSLKRLGRSHADLLLLHWPDKAIRAGSLSATWRGMEEAKVNGEAVHIGVCNCTIGALRELLSTCTIKPCVNQVERHPLLPQWGLFEFCTSEGIVLQAHSPLGGAGAGGKRLREHPVIQKVANEAGLSACQVLLGWNLRHGVAVVPKCSSGLHAAECLAAARHAPKLSAAHMRQLDTLSQSEVPMRVVNPSFMVGGAGVSHSSSFAW